MTILDYDVGILQHAVLPAGMIDVEQLAAEMVHSSD